MRAHEILGYIDFDRISSDLLRQLQDVFDRELKRPVDLVALGLQYGHAAADLEVEQAKAELAKTQAETERLQAAAAKERATVTSAKASLP